jgi:hypothetical protein
VIAAVSAGVNSPPQSLPRNEAVLRLELRATLSKLWPELVICAQAQNGF